MNRNHQVLYLSHGGGPLPLLGDRSHEEMVRCLKNIAQTIQKPSAIIVISAHWEEKTPTITAGETPQLIYDYSGFPEESYSITYPCQGNPDLARQIAKQFSEAKMEATLSDDRGYDHGLFVPLKIMYPDADIPCIQLSLLRHLDPAEHIRIGEILGKVEEGGSLLFIGSGFSFHNMRAFFDVSTEKTRQANESFEHWLLDICSRRDISEPERAEQLINWETAPSARFCHPREEHLLPLHVCYGIASGPCTKTFELEILSKKASMYLWDGQQV